MRHVRHWQSGITLMPVVIALAVVVAILLGLWQFVAPFFGASKRIDTASIAPTRGSVALLFHPS